MPEFLSNTPPEYSENGDRLQNNENEQIESADEEISSEYLQTLTEGIEKIRQHLYRLTWEIGLPEDIREKMHSSIEKEAAPYLIAGLAQPETAPEVLHILRSYCVEQSDSSLFPMLEQVMMSEQSNIARFFTESMGESADNAAAIFEKLVNYRTNEDAIQGEHGNNVPDVKLFIEEQIAPLVLDAISRNGQLHNEGSLAEKIPALGNDEQRVLLRQMILKQIMSNPESLKIIDSWYSHSLQADMFSHEFEQLVTEGLGQLNINSEEMLASWRHASGGELVAGVTIDKKDLNLALRENFKAVVQLEQHTPGLTNELKRTFGISMPGRFPVEMLIRQVEDPPRAGDSYGVAILPEADHNGTFMGMSSEFSRLGQSMNPDQKIVFYEAADLLDLVSSFNHARKNYNEAGKIGFAILVGHGTQDSIQFGGQRTDRAYNDVESKRSILYTGDIEKVGVDAVKSTLDEDVDIILISCDTGAEFGMANEMSYAMADATVTAAGIKTSETILTAYTKPSGKVGVSAEFNHGSTVKYKDGERVG